MLLIENQIPLIFLERLTSVAGLEVNLNGLIRSFYGCWYCEEDQTLIDPLGLHVLDGYRKGRLFLSEYTGWTVPKSAKELEEHSVRFIRSSGDVSIGGFKDVSFKTGRKRDVLGKLNDRIPSSLSQKFFFPLLVLHGDFYLPFLTIDETIGPILLNIMTFELLHLGIEERDMVFTHYMFLMRSLIHSERDVRWLHYHSILSSSAMQSDGAVVSFFADITRNVVVRDDARKADTVNHEILKLCGRRVNRLQGTWAYYYGSNIRMWFFTLVITIFSLINVVFNIIRYKNED